jgi:hypothetical protein
MAEQDFCLDDGRPVTVEYTYRPGSETTYSPMYGADGGDGCEVEITNCWPRSEAYEEFCRRRNARKWEERSVWTRPFAWIELQFVSTAIWLFEQSVRLTDDEYQRMEVWLIENHVYEPYEPEDF